MELTPSKQGHAEGRKKSPARLGGYIFTGTLLAFSVGAAGCTSTHSKETAAITRLDSKLGNKTTPLQSSDGARTFSGTVDFDFMPVGTSGDVGTTLTAACDPAKKAANVSNFLMLRIFNTKYRFVCDGQASYSQGIENKAGTSNNQSVSIEAPTPDWVIGQQQTPTVTG
jgi:hypothetical protein